MKKRSILIFIITFFVLLNFGQAQEAYKFSPFNPPVSYEKADKRADAVLAKMTLEEKVQLINGYNAFYIKGFEKYKMPQIFFTDATQGVRIQKNFGCKLEKSTAFPCPLALSATWNPLLAQKYASSIGEECRAGDIGFLLGPGMNIYRISQCGRNFEYFGEDPFLSARMIENYVTGLESTGTIATLKHFVCNNTDFYRHNSNSIVDERALHEIYLPAFKAGIDAGAMSVMTSYNLVKGEWASQNDYVINKLLRKDLGFKWLVMTDWGAIYDCDKAVKSGLDLEMPGDNIIKKDALRLLKEGKIKEEDINRMAKNIIRTCIAMGLYDRAVKDDRYLLKYPEHEKVALQTAREAIVLLKNENNILPVKKEKVKKILLTGDYVEELARGGGSAEVEGYNVVNMLKAFKNEFENKLEFVKEPTDDQIKSADIVILSLGTKESEGRDHPFTLPDEKERKVLALASKNPNIIVIMNSGSGKQMTGWEQKVKAIIYAWYPGQNGNIALAEIISGKTNPSGKLPFTIEKKFEDSPGYPYIPEGKKLYGEGITERMKDNEVYDIKYNEGVFVGYRWYEAKKIEPLYHFGFGLSFTSFEYGKLNLSKMKLNNNDSMLVEFTVKNTGKVQGAEVAQLYVSDIKSSVPRPLKELKGFNKVFLTPGETKKIRITLHNNDFAFWDVKTNKWVAEPGEFEILVGASSNDIRQQAKVSL